MLPLLAGVVPLALVIGARAATTDVGALAGWSTSWTVYGGSPQLLTLDLLDADASWFAIVLGVALLNLRLAVYATAMAPHWRSAPLRWRIAAGYLLVDPAFVVGDAYRRHAPHDRALHVHHLAASATLWIGWLAAVAAGIWIGDAVVAVLPAEVVLELVLVATVAPKLASRRGAAAIALVAAVALPTLALPPGTGVLVAAAAGAAVLVAGERAEHERVAPELDEAGPR